MSEQAAKSQSQPSEQPYLARQYLAITLDPLHVGAGGYRLGRVDNTIVREPGTKLPKLPGTSLSGVLRYYAALNQVTIKAPPTTLDCAGKGGEDGGKHCTGRPTSPTPSCAGKGGVDGLGHCGDPKCKVCMAFGFARGTKGSLQGMVMVGDARVLLFPVNTMQGPLWITCPAVLRDLAMDAGGSPCITRNDDTTVPTAKEKVVTNQVSLPGANGSNGHINLGWLLLEVERSAVPIKLANDHGLTCANGNALPALDDIIARSVLVHDAIFSQLVNANLEVRTSVSIDPHTGAAADAALFTYEALPRATVLWFGLTIQNPTHFKAAGAKINVGQPAIKELVETAMDYLPMLGAGGMGTRGMGRLQVLKKGA
jgi:CRISPR-associated protein Cmr4